MKNISLLAITLLCCIGLHAQTTIIQEGFESWPLEGWTNYETDGASSWGLCWLNDCAFEGNGAANHYGCNDGCEKWLISPQVHIASTDVSLSFWEFFEESNLQYYDYSAIMISTGSPDPLDGDFVELFTNPVNELPITYTQRIIDLSAFNGQDIYLALNFTGYWHNWIVDELMVAPPSFTDGAINSVINPVGTNPIPSLESVIVNLSNNGTETITDYTINWMVNDVAQTPYEVTGTSFLPGQDIDITIGDYDFNVSGDYQISASLVVANEYNPINNDFESIYYVTSEKDATILEVTPTGITPVGGLTDISVRIGNEGENEIIAATIDWEVDEVAQTPYEATGLSILPGEWATVVIGQYNFTQGITEMTVQVTVSGDIEPANDVFLNTIAIETFWESFEGPVFPPEGWSANWLLQDYFQPAPHGTKYALFATDNNFFGQITDTMFTPFVNVEAGDQLNFQRYFNPFIPGEMKIVWEDFETGVLTDIQVVTSPDNTFAPVTVNLSPALGVGRIGFIAYSVAYADQSIDAVTTNADLHLFPVDLSVRDFSTNYLAKSGEPMVVDFKLRNRGSETISGVDYSLKLMRTDGTEIASMNGVDLESWEQMELQFSSTLMELGEYELYVTAVLALAADAYQENNSTRPQKIHVVPADVVMIELGDDEYRELNFPFDFGGDTWTFSKDDISQSLFYQDEIDTDGLIYGMTYYYMNQFTNHLTFPLKVWIANTDAANLSNGWDVTSDFTLVLSDTLEISPGEMNALYIPFDTPVLYNNLSNLIVQHYAYDSGWPPGNGGVWAQGIPGGPDRVVRLMNSLEADPDNLPDIYGLSTAISKTTFVIQPINEVSSVTGTCYDENNIEFPDVNVEVVDQLINESSDALGAYSLPPLAYETYELKATAFGYDDNVQTVVLDQQATVVDFYMELRPQISLSADVVGSNDLGSPLAAVEAHAEGYDVYDQLSNLAGIVEFEDVYGNSMYNVTFSKYGYYPKTIMVDIADIDLDMGTVVLEQEFISPYHVVAEQVASVVEVTWLDPVTSDKAKFQTDQDVSSFSYTNEPQENVWLGNKFANSEHVTLQSVELKWDIYLLDSDFVTIDIMNDQEEVIASSEAFLTFADTLVTVNVPNIPIEGDFFVMVHWQNNDVNTHALTIDRSSGTENNAYIKYPGTPAVLLSDFLGSEPGAFIVRANVLKDGAGSGNSPLSYNISSGSPDDLQNVTLWPQLNTAPILTLDYSDTPDATGELIYAVEAIYPEGSSEHSFSNVVDFLVGLEELGSDILVWIYPNPTDDFVQVEFDLKRSASVQIEAFDALGKRVISLNTTSSPQVRESLDFTDLPSGSYSIEISLGEESTTRTIIKK